MNIRVALASCVLLTAVAAAPALAGHDYGYARISYVEGGFYLQRAENYQAGEVGVNTPVGGGDSIWTEPGSRLEIELGAGNYLRLDSNSRIDIRSTGTSSAISLHGGSLYVDLITSDRFEIDTPFASVYLLRDGTYRIDMGQQGGLLVSVHEGLAEVTNAAGSILVRDGLQTQVGSGRLPTYPIAFSMGRRDSFDDFQNARSGSLAYDLGGLDYLPAEVSYYGAELSAHGRWQYVSPYGFCWIPGNVAVDWRPYRDGYWDWVPGAGWVWVSYEPWGWAPYHYGRWDHVFGVGWCWIPGRVWSPAWVCWSNWNGYLGWCALNYYDRPCMIVNNYYDHWWNDSWVHNPDSRSWTFIPKEKIGGRDVGRIAIGDNEIKGIDRIGISKDPGVNPPRSLIVEKPIKGGSTIGGIGRGTGNEGSTSRTVPGARGTIERQPHEIGPVGRTGGEGAGNSGSKIIYVGPKGGDSGRTGSGVNPPFGGSKKVEDGGSGSSVIRLPPGSSGRVEHTPSPDGGSSTGGSVKVDEDGAGRNSSSRIYHYDSRTGTGTNATTIERDPETRQYEDYYIDHGIPGRPNSAENADSSDESTFWGKVYDQFRSSSNSGSKSSSDKSTVTRSGSDSRSGSSSSSSSSSTRSGSSGNHGSSSVSKSNSGSSSSRSGSSSVGSSRSSSSSSGSKSSSSGSGGSGNQIKKDR